MSSSVWLLTRSRPSNSTLPRTRCNGASHGSAGHSTTRLAARSLPKSDIGPSELVVNLIGALPPAHALHATEQRVCNLPWFPRILSGVPSTRLASYRQGGEAGSASSAAHLSLSPTGRTPSPAPSARGQSRQMTDASARRSLVLTTIWRRTQRYLPNL